MPSHSPAERRKRNSSSPSKKKMDTGNLVSPFNNLDAIHINNFFDGIRDGSNKLNADIESGHKSTFYNLEN